MQKHTQILKNECYNEEKGVLIMGRKIICGKCGETKDVRHFYKNITRIGGVNTICRDCQKKYREEQKKLKQQ